MTIGAQTTSGAFVGQHEHADVTAIIVTYQSAATIGPLLRSLRDQCSGVRMRVVVADNGSSDATARTVLGHPDVVLVRTGRNLGYAGGINAALRVAGETDSLLVLNPDIRLEPHAVERMRARLERESAGVVVPLILSAGGERYPSLRREPSLTRALGDALLGSHLPTRAGFLSEMVREPSAYGHAHPVDWATGAVMLIAEPTARAVGRWDERYFLYSEETDYLRRVRGARATVWFEPGARAVHLQGASGSSPALDALMSVNRIVYHRAHHGPLTTGRSPRAPCGPWSRCTRHCAPAIRCTAPASGSCSTSPAGGDCRTRAPIARPVRAPASSRHPLSRDLSSSPPTTRRRSSHQPWGRSPPLSPPAPGTAWRSSWRRTGARTTPSRSRVPSRG